LRLCPSTTSPRSAIAAVPSIGRAVHVERAAREADATQDLFERYSGQIYGFCVNKLGSRDEAEDALQSTFLNAHRALQRGVVPEAELAWLYTIAHNVCLTRQRSMRRRGRVESPSDLAAVQDVTPAPPRETSEDLMRLTEALEHMPDSQRRAILLREWQGLSYHEIAEELDVTQSAVETLIFRARRTLASNLDSQQGRFGAVSRMRRALDAGALLAALKGLFEGGAAAKVAVVAVAASGTVVVATAPPLPVSKPAPQEQAVKAVSQAAPARVLFDRPRVQATRTAPTKSAPAPVEAPVAADAQTPSQSALLAAAVVANPKQHKPKHEAKATPPGRAKKLAPAPAAKSKGQAVKVKGKKAKSNGARVDRVPAPAQPLVAPAAPQGQADVSEKDKGPKK
jgi:RNA polymerase sigma factor (sigma-70 family)